MKSVPPRRRPMTVVACVMLAAGVWLAAVPVAHAVVAQVSAAQAKAIWEKWKQSHAATPAKAVPAPGEPVFWLRVPSCKINTLVMQESDEDALQRFPAARRLESGGRVVFAHRDIHFRPLAAVRVGDVLSVEAVDGHLATYTVRSIRVLLPEQVPAAVDDPEYRDSLHLLTCYPFHYIGAAPKRFLVTASKSATASNGSSPEGTGTSSMMSARWPQ